MQPRIFLLQHFRICYTKRSAHPHRLLAHHVTTGSGCCNSGVSLTAVVSSFTGRSQAPKQPKAAHDQPAEPWVRWRVSQQGQHLASAPEFAPVIFAATCEFGLLHEAYLAHRRRQACACLPPFTRHKACCEARYRVPANNHVQNDGNRQSDWRLRISLAHQV